MELPAISVKQFVDLVNETLSFAYTEVAVEGEISGAGLRRWGDRLIFFTLVEEDTSIECAIEPYRLKLEVEAGMTVKISGQPKLWRTGKLIFKAVDLTPTGEGELKRSFELLRKKLESEGLFRPERRRPLPQFPQTIGLITSERADAYQDFMKKLNERWSGVTVHFAHVDVQGRGAPEQITNAINYFNQLSEPVDVLVLIRGGGSYEDLMTFSTEPVVRAVAASRTPTVVGVGHQDDASWADFAADVRAMTPTDAAIRVVPDRAEIQRQLQTQAARIVRSLRHLLTGLNQQLHRRLGVMEYHLNFPADRLRQAAAVLKRDLSHFQTSLRANGEKLAASRRQLILGQSGSSLRLSERLVTLERLLAGTNPRAVLRRGYSIVRQHERILKSATSVRPGSALMIELYEGKLRAKVERDLN